MKYDPKEWAGHNQRGEVVGVDDLTPEELKQNLCKCMDFLERYSTLFVDMQELEKWRDK